MCVRDRINNDGVGSSRLPSPLFCLHYLPLFRRQKQQTDKEKDGRLEYNDNFWRWDRQAERRRTKEGKPILILSLKLKIRSLSPNYVYITSFYDCTCLNLIVYPKSNNISDLHYFNPKYPKR
jgi:hypothetical protein